jgi:hypothetical protein
LKAAATAGSPDIHLGLSAGEAGGALGCLAVPYLSRDTGHSVFCSFDIPWNQTQQ